MLGAFVPWIEDAVARHVREWLETAGNADWQAGGYPVEAAVDWRAGGYP